MINYGKHNIIQSDIDAVVDVLENHFLTQGDKVPEFEAALCDYTGAKYCTAVNSGTSGLHVACLALGIGNNDIVWTSPNSFAASANCALYCGAQVDFVDIDPHTRNICVDALEIKLAWAKKNKCLPRAVVVVHFSGITCDMRAIHAICNANNVAIIEDAAHSLGASYENEQLGSCQYSDLAVLSFHPVKSITTAEGGAVLTNDPDLAKHCALFAKHGITRDPMLMTHALGNETLGEHNQGTHNQGTHNQGIWYYQQLVLGYNYRLSDLQAALGLSQLSRIESFMQSRRSIAKRYFAGLKDLPLRLPMSDEIEKASWHLFMVEVLEHNRKDVFESLHAKGIAVNVHYIPIHLHPYYQQLGFKEGDFPHAENFYNNAITLPIYAGLEESQQNYVIDTLTSLLK